MSDPTNPPVVTVTDDLDAFAAQLFGQSEATDEAATSQEAPTETEQEVDASDTETVDTQTIEDTDTLAPDDSDNEETDAEPDETQEKPKKNRYQERIDELTSKYREAERQREADRKTFEERLKALESPTTSTEQTTNDGPDPNTKLENGRDKYPLGEYDPNYVRDLAKWEVANEFRTIEERRKQEEQERTQSAQLEQLQNSWAEKLTPAQERYPDFLQKSQDLLESMNGLDLAYEDYISATIMGMDYGPDVLYYLASNPTDAKTIINSGAAKATVALGRIEAKFAEADAEKTLARPKVSNAPVPPPTIRGTAAAKMPTAPDTDDLDAFSRELFKKGR
jgi:hypothetical protein